MVVTSLGALVTGEIEGLDVGLVVGVFAGSDVVGTEYAVVGSVSDTGYSK